MFLSFLLIVLPFVSAGNYVNSKDDIYLKVNSCGYKIPVKSSYVRSDYGGIEEPYHAYYAEPSAGYTRYYDYDGKPKQTTREYTASVSVPSEPVEMKQTRNGGIRQEHTYATFREPGQPYIVDPWKYPNMRKSSTIFSYCSDCTPIHPSIRSESFRKEGSYKQSTIDIKDIPGIKPYTVKDKPDTVVIMNNPDNFYYKSTERSTLPKARLARDDSTRNRGEEPSFYYEVEVKTYRGVMDE